MCNWESRQKIQKRSVLSTREFRKRCSHTLYRRRQLICKSSAWKCEGQQTLFPHKTLRSRKVQKRPEIEKAHKIYKDMVCEKKEGHEAVSKPRNVKQIHNVRTAQKGDLILTRDAIYNTHELAYEGGFIHYISTYPDLAVVAGSKGIID